MKFLLSLSRTIEMMLTTTYIKQVISMMMTKQQTKYRCSWEGWEFPNAGLRESCC